MRWIADNEMVKLIDDMLPLICGPHRKDRYGHVRKTLREKNFPCAKWSLPFELFKHLCETRSELNRVREEGEPIQEVPPPPPPPSPKVDERLKRENDMLKRELEREKKLSQAYSDMIDILRSQ
tara:strand:- start:29 stop:397 length:369 start_codon:yes stop_codon:yes gene_type:complete